MSSVKTILICQYPLPFSKIGSWTNMYNFYLKQSNCQLDYVICPKSDTPVDTVEYVNLRPLTVADKVKSKIQDGKRFANYFEALSKIVQPNQKYIIQIIDHKGLLLPLHQFIIQSFNRKHFYIQYFYHGFSPLIEDSLRTQYFNAVDEMIFLTKLSYQEHLKKYDDFVILSSVLHDATNEKLFYKLSDAQKKTLKQQNKISDKLVFIWCSQDRPKKGLDLILKVWKYIYQKYSDKVVLQVVGTQREIQQKGVVNIGRVPNTELAKYYQMSDVYLFPSLWKEGFGIVLAEALRCGCYCIASNQGGIPEVLQFGKLGKLVDFPNNINAWVQAIETAIQDFETHKGINKYATNIPEDIYSLATWSNQLNTIIDEAKFIMET